MKKKILLISKTQFGYLIDVLKYCEYLNEKFAITVICHENHLKKIEVSHVTVIYVSSEGNARKRLYRFFAVCLKMIRDISPRIVFINYFRLCSVLRIFGNKAPVYIMDIRTGTIGGRKIKRYLYNKTILLDSFFFSKITIITQSLQRKLGISDKKTYLLPLSADEISLEKKSYLELKFLYVGTLNNRNIEETVYGLKKWIDQMGGDLKKQESLCYDIIGYGEEKEEKKLHEAILRSSLQAVVRFHGRISHTKLMPYFQKCNVGISYIPSTEYYECQPATKTYEYIKAGMICIATNTKENRKIIEERNGILCDDNRDSFSDAVKKIFDKRGEYRADLIQKTLEGNNWKKLITEDLYHYYETSMK